MRAPARGAASVTLVGLALLLPAASAQASEWDVRMLNRGGDGTTPGLYGYKCLPHLGMGMVGLIQVGGATNRNDAAQAADRLPGRGKSVMLRLLGQVR